MLRLFPVCAMKPALLLAALLLAVPAGAALSAEYIRANQGAMWGAFKQTHGRRYPSPLEDVYRRGVFIGNMFLSVGLELANPDASFGPNKFADWTPEEFRRYRNLKVPRNATPPPPPPPPPPMEVHERPTSSSAPPVVRPGTAQDVDALLAAFHAQTAAVANATAPPPPLRVASATAVNIDWRVIGAVTGVTDQGACGCCYAFSSIAALESAQWIATRRLTPLSVQEVVSCDNSGWDHGCDGGWMPNTLDWIVGKKGGEVVTMEAYPYKSASGVSGACRSTAGMAVGAQMAGYTTYMAKTEDFLADILRDEGPIITAVSSASWQTYTGGVLSNCACPFGVVDHGVVLVGVTPSYWIVKNSWGDDWGESGYIRLAFGSDQCHLTSIPIVPRIGKPTPSPTPPVPPSAFQRVVFSGTQCTGTVRTEILGFGTCFRTSNTSSAVALSCGPTGVLTKMYLGNINCQGFAVSAAVPVEQCVVNRGEYITNYCHKTYRL